ncbi:MAG: hypothetical protein BroJett040_19900 [Oligoflexia bacterium]|nr:MAG: hypothetical protein BroJett040_19900 [Oligoflexia bacterium]
MKILRVLLFSLIIFGLFSIQAIAETHRINPTSLRSLVLKQNTSVLLGLNQVHQAKAQLNLARASLLPGVSLALSQPSGQPSFILSSVSILMPFLLPSNWFNLSKTKAMLRAEEAAYRLVQLNAYASVYSMYNTMSGDFQIREALWQQYQDLKSIAYILEQQDKLTGAADPKDLAMARAQAELARLQVSQMDELLVKEKAALRHALGLALEDEIIFENAQVPESDFENQDMITVAQRSLEVAPENVQIDQMVIAAKKDFWAKTFSFLTGATLSAQAYNSGGQMHSAAFSSLSEVGTASFSFGQFPMMELASNNKDQLLIRKKEVQLQMNQIVESALGSLDEVRKQVGYAEYAEKNYIIAYNIELERYRLGINDVSKVLYAKRDVSTATLAKIRVMVDLGQQRINLHRIGLTDQFAEVKGCAQLPSESVDSKGGLLKALRGIFKPSEEVNLVKLCQN